MMRKRTIEARLAALEAQTQHATPAEPMLVYEDPETGAWYADQSLDGEPLDPADTDPLVVLQETVVETDWSPEQ